MRRAFWCLLAGWLLALALAAPAPALAADPVSFGEQSVSSTFLQRIEFRLGPTTSASEITDARLYYGHIQDPVRTQVRATVQPGRQIEATYTLNTRERYLPPGSEIEYYWEVRDAAGGRHESPRQRFTYIDERYSWRSRTDGLITFHWHSGDDAFAQDVLDTAQRTLDQLEQQVGATPTEPINIYFYGSNSDLAGALPPNSAEWIGGQAYPALNLILAGVRPDSGAAREVRRMIPHELSHIVLHQATKNPYNTPPTWLDEGLAVHAQETPDSRFPGLIRDAVRANRLIPLRALNSSFPLDPNEAVLSYAQSASVVEFILDRHGPDRAAALVAVFREGVSYDEAVQRALGVTIEELDAQWRDWLSARGSAPGGGDLGATPGGPGDLIPEIGGIPNLGALDGVGPLLEIALVAGLLVVVVLLPALARRLRRSP